MINQWSNRKEESIKHNYDHCAIAHGQDVYKDCPSLLKHWHFSSINSNKFIFYFLCHSFSQYRNLFIFVGFHIEEFFVLERYI